MEFIPVHTKPLLPPKDDLYALMDAHLPALQEGDIVLVTSKVLAIHQGRCVPMTAVPDKDELIVREAERYIPRKEVPGARAVLTIKHHTLIASSGIDESNGNGYYVLWPERIDESTREIWEYLRQKNNSKNLGVILTDSHTIPLRWGVMGISIAHAGFEPLVNLIGKQDIFGRPITMTKQNIPDTLAAFGVHLMGESDECTPLLVVRGFPVVFTEEDTNDKLRVDPKQDIFKPLLGVFTTRKM